MSGPAEDARERELPRLLDRRLELRLELLRLLLARFREVLLLVVLRLRVIDLTLAC